MFGAIIAAMYLQVTWEAPVLTHRMLLLASHRQFLQHLSPDLARTVPKHFSPLCRGQPRFINRTARAWELTPNLSGTKGVFQVISRLFSCAPPSLEEHSGSWGCPSPFGCITRGAFGVYNISLSLHLLWEAYINILSQTKTKSHPFFPPPQISFTRHSNFFPALLSLQFSLRMPEHRGCSIPEDILYDCFSIILY